MNAVLITPTVYNFITISLMVAVIIGALIFVKKKLGIENEDT